MIDYWNLFPDKNPLFLTIYVPQLYCKKFNL